MKRREGLVFFRVGSSNFSHGVLMVSALSRGSVEMREEGKCEA